MVRRGIEADAPFPALYDWTAGELIEFIECKNNAKIATLKERARLDFEHACLIIKLLNKRDHAPVKFSEIYDFLYTEEERKKIKADAESAAMINYMISNGAKIIK